MGRNMKGVGEKIEKEREKWKGKRGRMVKGREGEVERKERENGKGKRGRMVKGREGEW